MPDTHRVLVLGGGLPGFFEMSEGEKANVFLPAFRQLLARWEELGARVVASFCDDVLQVGPAVPGAWAWYLIFELDDLDVAAQMIGAVREPIDGVRLDRYVRFEARIGRPFWAREKLAVAGRSEVSAMGAKPIPDGYERPIPFLAVDDAARAIAFYQRAFGARERMRMSTPDGKVAHAEIELAGSILMLADPLPQYDWRPPSEFGGTTVAIGLYVVDVDAAVQRAVEAGATVAVPVEDKFYGDRYGVIRDPFGHDWQLATHTEDVAPEEIAERARRSTLERG
jgi:PhnB protein